MNTNTIMLIVLAVLVILSTVGIWLANRGSGVEDPNTPEEIESEEDIEHTEDTRDPKIAKDTHE